jgi:predicted porin
MSKKLLSVAIAAAVAAPLAVQAEIKLSGTAQAEVGSLEIGGADSVTRTQDGTGALAGGGPNKVRLDLSEDLGGGLSAFGRLDWAFNTSSGGGLADREKFVGLKSSTGAYFRTGRIEGAYKTSTKIDPFYSTAGQMRIGGGESSGAFSNGGFVNNVVELGFSGGGFKVALQGVFDEIGGSTGTNAGEDGSYLANAEYGNDMFTVYGAYASRENRPSASDVNWKAGAKTSFGGLGLGVQYEDAEMNTADLAPSASGEYITGSVTYGLGGVTLAGWVSQYSDDTGANLDAMSYAVGGIYSFSKKTIAYAAYHSIDVDAAGDAGDLSAFAAGIRHNF